MPGLRCLRGARVRGKRQWGEEGGNGVVRDLRVLIKSGVDGRGPQAWGGAEPWTRRQEEDVFSFEILNSGNTRGSSGFTLCARFYIGFPCTLKRFC